MLNKEEEEGNTRPEAVVKALLQLTSAVATFLLGVLLHPAAQLRPVVQLKFSAEMLAAELAPVTAIRKVIRKLLTFMLKVIAGSVMTPAATMLTTILTTLGNTDALAAELAPATFIA